MMNNDGKSTSTDTTDAPSEAGNTQAPEKSATPPMLDWESDNNPYKYVATNLQQEVEKVKAAQLQGAAANYEQYLIANGVPAAQAAETTRVQLEAAQQKLSLEAREKALNTQARPLVAQMLAEQIKTQFGVEIKPAELMNTSAGKAITDPEAMLARADALVSERISAKKQVEFNARKTKGADTADKGGAPSTNDTKGLAPINILTRGLARLKENS